MCGMKNMKITVSAHVDVDVTDAIGAIVHVICLLLLSFIHTSIYSSRYFTLMMLVLPLYHTYDQTFFAAVHTQDMI